MKIAEGLTLILLLVHSTIEGEEEEELEEKEEDGKDDSQPQLPPGEDCIHAPP